jgi:Icc-related predicted phosphoesterase
LGFLRRGRKPTFSLFFATDLHGSEKCFRKFLKAAEFYNVDALVLGGDLTGKLMVSVVEQPDGSHTATFLDREVVARSDEELAQLETNIRFNGHYVYHCTPAELTALQGDEESQRNRFREVIRDDLRRWVERADELLAKSGIPCVGIPGNDDEDFVGEILASSQSIANGEGRVVELGPLQVLSCGYSNPTPWNSPREVSEEQLAEWMEAAAADLEPGRPTLFNVHVPPFNTGLDLAPELDENLGLKSGAASNMVPVGTKAGLEVITRHQPALSLHGHVHESRGSAKLGRTVALNPGSEYNVGVLRGAIVRLAGDEVLSHQFVSA